MAFEKETKTNNENFGFSDNPDISAALAQSKKLDKADHLHTMNDLSNLSKTRRKKSNSKLATYYIDSERRDKFQRIAEERGYRSASELLRDIIDNLN